MTFDENETGHSVQHPEIPAFLIPRGASMTCPIISQSLAKYCCQIDLITALQFEIRVVVSIDRKHEA